jgi:hypothetical protein
MAVALEVLHESRQVRPPHCQDLGQHVLGQWQTI